MRLHQDSINKDRSNFRMKMVSRPGWIILFALYMAQFGCGGASMCRVPDVRNKSISEARRILKQKGFGLRDVYGDGTIVSEQNPTPGAEVWCGWENVDLWLKSEESGYEPEPTSAPDIPTSTLSPDEDRIREIILQVIAEWQDQTGLEVTESKKTDIINKYFSSVEECEIDVGSLQRTDIEEHFLLYFENLQKGDDSEFVVCDPFQ